MTRGLTLVELVITISLTAILSIPVGILISEHLTAAIRTRDVMVAMNLARYEMERLDSLNDFFAAPDLNIVSTTVQNYQGFPYTMVRAVDCLVGDCTSILTTSQGVKRIRITVFKPTDSNPLATQMATVVTYRAKHVLFGS